MHGATHWQSAPSVRAPTGAAVARTARWPPGWSCTPSLARTGAAHRALWRRPCAQGRRRGRLAPLQRGAYPCTPPQRPRQGCRRRHAPLHARQQGLHPAAQWLPAPRLPPGEASTTQRHGQRQALAGARRCARAGARCARRAPGATARLPARSAAAALAFRGPAGVQELLCTASMLPSSCHHSPAHILGVAYCRVETGE